MRQHGRVRGYGAGGVICALSRSFLVRTVNVTRRLDAEPRRSINGDVLEPVVVFLDLLSQYLELSPVPRLNLYALTSSKKNAD